jgi:hypothetical protein
MNDSSNTAAGLDQADEEILTYTVSDEALEAAASMERMVESGVHTSVPIPVCCPRGSSAPEATERITSHE